MDENLPLQIFFLSTGVLLIADLIRRLHPKTPKTQPYARLSSIIPLTFDVTRPCRVEKLETMATKEKEVDPVDDKDAIDALEAEAKEFDKVPRLACTRPFSC